jgi:hypothetical protein
MLGRIWVDSGSIWDRFGVDLGSLRGRFWSVPGSEIARPHTANLIKILPGAISFDSLNLFTNSGGGPGCYFGSTLVTYSIPPYTPVSTHTIYLLLWTFSGTLPLPEELQIVLRDAVIFALPYVVFFAAVE